MKALNGRFAALQIQGDRDYQEDEYGLLDNSDQSAAGEEHTVMVLADGMGGHAGGAEASHIVSSTFLEAYQKSEGSVAARLEAGLEQANAAVKRAVADNPSLDGMGCTLVGVSVTAEGLQWISVGDSPMWLFRDDQLIRLNEDHSMLPVLKDMVEAGRLSEEDMAKDRRKNALRSAVMGEEIPLVDLHDKPVALRQEDCLLIASDGLETLSEEQISAVLMRGQKNELEETGQRLLAAVEAVKKPYQDNTTVVLFKPQKDWGDGASIELVIENGANKKNEGKSKKGLSGMLSRLFKGGS